MQMTGALGWGLAQGAGQPSGWDPFSQGGGLLASPAEQRPWRGEWLAAAGFGQEKGDAGAKETRHPILGRGHSRPREPSVWAGEGPVLSAWQGSSAKRSVTTQSTVQTGTLLRANGELLVITRGATG